MPIYKIKNRKAIQVSKNDAGLSSEAELRDFFTSNLEEILGIRFLENEYPTDGGRIDTLGIDENNSPVIIEYKWKENEGVLAQGLFYFDWLIKNKKHFELLVDSKLGKDIKVNWDQPRIILIAQGFNRYTLSAVQQVKYVELKTYSYYEPDIFQIENIFNPVALKIRKEGAGDKEYKSYSPKYYLKKTSKEMQKLVELLRKKILELPEVKENFGKSGIYYRTTKSFVRLEFRSNWIQLIIRDFSYKEDTMDLVKDVTSNKWGYRGMIKFTPESDIDYIFSLVKQSYESTL